jgi:hypothetical protein
MTANKFIIRGELPICLIDSISEDLDKSIMAYITTHLAINMPSLIEYDIEEVAIHLYAGRYSFSAEISTKSTKIEERVQILVKNINNNSEYFDENGILTSNGQ